MKHLSKFNLFSINESFEDKEEIKDFVYSYLKPKGFNSRLLNRDAYSLDL